MRPSRAVSTLLLCGRQSALADGDGRALDDLGGMAFRQRQPQVKRPVVMRAISSPGNSTVPSVTGTVSTRPVAGANTSPSRARCSMTDLSASAAAIWFTMTSNWVLAWSTGSGRLRPAEEVVGRARAQFGHSGVATSARRSSPERQRARARSCSIDDDGDDLASFTSLPSLIRISRTVPPMRARHDCAAFALVRIPPWFPG